MSNTSIGLAEPHRATSAIGATFSSLARGSVALARRRWAAYWDDQARRAAVLTLQALDDRTLKDIGLTRSEIWPAVFGQHCSRHGFGLAGSLGTRGPA